MGNSGRLFTLYPEEMLFLVDKGRLALYADPSPQPISLEECYQLLLDAKIPFDNYIVYSHLKALGCVVFRHDIIKYTTEQMPDFHLNVLFDVWLPKAGHKWSRKAPGLPSFFVVLNTSQSPFQSAILLSQIADAISTSSIPIKLATVNGGLLDFFDCQQPLPPTAHSSSSSDTASNSLT